MITAAADHRITVAQALKILQCSPNHPIVSPCNPRARPAPRTALPPVIPGSAATLAAATARRTANPVPASFAPGAYSALDTCLGLFAGRDFRLTSGRCNDCAAIPQALWYFADETIAAPRPGLAVAGFARGISTWQDVHNWAATADPAAPCAAPPLIWIAAPEVLRHATLAQDGATLTAGGDTWSFEPVPKIALNRSYFNAASIANLALRPLSVRGSRRNGAFIARTIWPEDFRLDSSAALQPVDATPAALQALVRAEPLGGARSPFAAIPLWERAPGTARRWDGAPVIAAMLNGAQSDDDEALAGHFALVTGRVGSAGDAAGPGAMGDWLANNFYTLDQESEKGILAAMLPLDNYLADLNSGQAWYRPSYLLVAVLRSERVANIIQGALARTYNQFYRHQLVYDHPTMNCTSISVKVLRTLGWKVPSRGATSWPAAALGLPYFALRNSSLAKAALSFDYLTEDQTRLFPAAGFEEIGADLLRLATGRSARAPTPFETMFAEDLEAVIFVRVPQLPSSRVWGDFPVAGTWEYRARYPRDPAQAKIIPVPQRPFPERLRDSDLLPPPRRRGDIALAVWAVLSVVGIPWLLWRAWQGRHRDALSPVAINKSRIPG